MCQWPKVKPRPRLKQLGCSHRAMVHRGRIKTYHMYLSVKHCPSTSQSRRAIYHHHLVTLFPTRSYCYQKRLYVLMVIWHRSSIMRSPLNVQFPNGLRYPTSLTIRYHARLSPAAFTLTRAPPNRRIVVAILVSILTTIDSQHRPYCVYHSILGIPEEIKVVRMSGTS